MTHALTYDTLPPHSTLRREVADGVMKITAAAEEPTDAARREARLRAALPAAMLSGALLVAFIAAVGSTFLANRRNIGSELMVVLFAAFVVFCAALFLLVWRAQYAARVEALERAFRQTTILAAAPGRLLIETSGPLGQESQEVHTARDEAGGIVGMRLSRGGCMSCIHILVSGRIDGPRVLCGRSEAELRWVLRTLEAALYPGP
jgi:hypothetical protein